MSTEHNTQLVRRWKEELWSKGNVSIIDELCAPDYVCHMSGLPVPGPVRGQEALKHLFAIYFAAFEIHDIPEFGVPVAVGQKTTFKAGFVVSTANLSCFWWRNCALSAVQAKVAADYP
jgi:hypothetical protein